MIVWERQERGGPWCLLRLWLPYHKKRDWVKQQERSLRPGRGSPEGVGAGAVRPGTLRAFGAWELPQGLGDGKAKVTRLQRGLSGQRA